MKTKKSVKIISALIGLLLCAAVSNFPVSTKQGINYIVRTIKIPLYIKFFEFMDRDYHYRVLVKDIIKGYKDEKEKTLAIFKWVCRNIRTNIPGGWPIVDDHVWYTIVRGYGTDDQSADVFATLCVYAGLDIRFEELVYDSERKLLISAVKLKGEWIIFDPYYRVYFKTPSGEIATVKDLLTNPSLIESQTNSILRHGIKYSEYFKNLSSVNFDKIPKPRAYRQNLFKRIFYEMKKLL